MPRINKSICSSERAITDNAYDKYMKYEKAVRVRTQKTFTITLSDNSYEYLNTCCDVINKKYGFYPTRQQQSDMVQRLLMKPKAPIEY
tara:strand:- start:356 stop:619 length:264 start_codon:yes stop_codon:yes gene_type:complete